MQSFSNYNTKGNYKSFLIYLFSQMQIFFSGIRRQQVRDQASVSTVCDGPGTKTKGMLHDSFCKLVSPDLEQLVHNHDEASFQNKGAPTRTMEDLEDTTSRDGVGI